MQNSSAAPKKISKSKQRKKPVWTLSPLSKHFVREHSLFYGSVWYKSDFLHIAELWGHTINRFVIVKNVKSRKMENWNNETELDDIYRWVKNQLRTNPAYFELVKKRFYQYLTPMLPYLNKQKKIENPQEFQDFYNNWLHWWPPMDSSLLIPDFEEVPEKIREEALKMRQKTHRWTEELDFVFVNFFCEQYPCYKALVDIILPEEVFLLEKRNLTKKEVKRIAKRKSGCAIFRGKLFSMPRLKAVLEKNGLFLDTPKDLHLTELKGMAAYPGVVKGKARLVLYKKNIHEVNRGEILVAEMTSPDFVPAMRKAAAVVTDEGGITCHAAIVCRELKKPCVVGTQSVTKSIKTGNLIEVDANQGTVRILSQK
ncbi:MAG: PEP-utilizing enzyme [Candidatus Micrarchaeota archaeon]